MCMHIHLCSLLWILYTGGDILRFVLWHRSICDFRLRTVYIYIIIFLQFHTLMLPNVKTCSCYVAHSVNNTKKESFELIIGCNRHVF